MDQDFVNLCKALADLSLRDDYKPDVVIGILTGGGIMGKICNERFQEKIVDKTVKYAEVKLQRVSTKAKNKIGIRTVLNILPRPVLNWMRIIEVYFFEVKVLFVKPRREGILQFDEETEEILKERHKKVLLIDDCIDTGYTLKIIRDFIINNYPGNEVRIAVATVSHHRPVIRPNYTLYNRVLLRFPWAYDVKHENKT
ncbi:MAG: hypothetical protein LUI85_01615 [Bacteroides sp.]|nr:hypothetical protein [Bacteroides sp.]